MSRKNFTEITIGVLAITSIVLVVIESLFDVSKGTLMGLYIADLVICVIFAGDFIQRLVTSESRSRFMKSNWYEILAMIPAFSLYAIGAIPAISGALRALRLVRVVFLLARMRRAMTVSGGFFRGNYLVALFALTLSVILVAAFVVLILEKDTNTAQITTFSDAIWWSITTVTTVGYGDVVPHTIGGRVMGMALMFIGIAVMTAFISQISVLFIESRMKHSKEADDFRSTVITEIKKKLDNVDGLSESEFSLLIRMIRSLKKTE